MEEEEEATKLTLMESWQTTSRQMPKTKRGFINSVLQ